MSRQQARPTYGNTDRSRGRDMGRSRAYIEGNTVRKLDAAPKRAPQQEKRQREEQRRVEHQTRVNRQRAMQMSPGYIVFLTLAVFMTVGICALYIQLQSEVSSRMKRVSTLDSQILNMRMDNDAALNRIETSVNLEEIKNTAINEMGMVYPGQDQIVYFTVDMNDYMNQYQDIPEK